MGVEIAKNTLAPSQHLYGNGITGVETMIRDSMQTSATLGASGAMRLSYLTAVETRSVSTAVTATGSTAAGATPTLVRFGLYSVDVASGDITLVASTANDTSLLAATTTEYAKALSSSYTVVAGQRYAAAILVVSGATIPTIAGNAPQAGSSTLLRTPRMSGLVSGQADLPATVASGSIAASGVRHWIAFV